MYIIDLIHVMFLIHGIISNSCDSVTNKRAEPSGNQPQQPDIDYLIRESAQDTPQLGNNLDILNIESTTSTPAVDVIAPISNNLVGDQGNEKLLSDEENEKLHRILCDFPVSPLTKSSIPFCQTTKHQITLSIRTASLYSWPKRKSPSSATKKWYPQLES